MKKGNFTQSVTNFKNKSKNVQPVVVEVDLVDSLVGDEKDKAPTIAAVNAGLKGKVSVAGASANHRLYGVTNLGEAEMFTVNAGNTINVIPKFTRSDLIGDKDSGGTFAVTTPTKKYHPANKKYVDDRISPIEERIGQIVSPVELSSTWGSYELPQFTFQDFYVKSTDFEYTSTINWETGEQVRKSSTYDMMYFEDEIGNVLSSIFVKPNSYYTMPKGTKTIRTDASDVAGSFGDWDAMVLDCIDPITILTMGVI